MELNNILTSNMLDIVFNGRNKDYGAYQLRKNYNKIAYGSNYNDSLLPVALFERLYCFKK